MGKFTRQETILLLFPLYEAIEKKYGISSEYFDTIFGESNHKGDPNRMSIDLDIEPELEGKTVEELISIYEEDNEYSYDAFRVLMRIESGLTDEQLNEPVYASYDV